MSTHNVYFNGEISKNILQLSPNTLLICSTDHLGLESIQWDSNLHGCDLKPEGLSNGHKSKPLLGGWNDRHINSCNLINIKLIHTWTASSEFGTYHLCEQRRFRRACASAQSRQNLRCSLIQAVSQEEPSDRKPDPWPLWMAGHAQLKFVMTECSKTQIRLTGLTCTSLLHWD